MCIHFLQQRRPAVLPCLQVCLPSLLQREACKAYMDVIFSIVLFVCLSTTSVLFQEMQSTYSVTVENIECAFFDQVDKLRDFGSHNREPIAKLVWAFFNYWAYGHDYANSVISVRTGSILR